jgi:hypothetical protein
MNITSAKYMADIKTGENSCINIVSEDKLISVPLDPDNTDYAFILEWSKEDGNEIAAAD